MGRYGKMDDSTKAGLQVRTLGPLSGKFGSGLDYCSNRRDGPRLRKDPFGRFHATGLDLERLLPAVGFGGGVVNFEAFHEQGDESILVSIDNVGFAGALNAARQATKFIVSQRLEAPPYQLSEADKAALAQQRSPRKNRTAMGQPPGNSPVQSPSSKRFGFSSRQRAKGFP